MVPSIEHRDGNCEHLNEKRLTLKAPYKGVIEQLYTAPPAGGVVVCLDEMGRPELSRPATRETSRARGRTCQTGDRLRPAGQRLRFRGLPAGQWRGLYSPL